MKSIMHHTLIIILVISFNTLIAQSSSDILKYTLARPSSTARFEGAGSSFGAIGADPSSIGINPAGLGLYRKSDFSFGIYSNQAIGKYSVPNDFIFQTNNNTSGNAKNIGMSNLSLVISKTPKSYSKWSNINYHFGYNLSSSFDQQLNYRGLTKGSIVHRFLENAIDTRYDDGRGVDPNNLDPFEGDLAYKTGALFDISNDSNKIVYSNDLLTHSKDDILKKGSYNAKGFFGSLNFGVGANYNEKLIIGASIDFPMGYYQVNKEHIEEDLTGDLKPFKYLKFNDNNYSEISGVKGSLGIIYKPINQLRIGFAWHSPTLLYFNDEYTTELSYEYIINDTINSYSDKSPDGVFNYNMITPSKWVGSIAFVSKLGFINADFDYFNPTRASFLFEESNEQEYQDELNASIDKQFKPVLQTRIGIEIPIHKLRIRSGIGILNSPYANDNSSYYSYSAGIGYRLKKFYIDFSGKTTTFKDAYVPFATGNSDFNNDRIPDAVETLVQSNLRNNQFMLTLGFKF